MNSKIISFIISLIIFLVLPLSLVTSGGFSICRVPVYEGICCSDYTGEYKWPSGNGVCCGGIPYPGLASCYSYTCGNDLCENNETQENCPSDCKTEIKIIPSETRSQDEVNVSISFSDSRYKHETGTRIKIYLLLNGASWEQNCFSNIPIVLRNNATMQTCNWNYGKNLIECGSYNGNMTLSYSPTSNKLKIDGRCQLPALPSGYHTVNATITFFVIKT